MLTRLVPQVSLAEQAVGILQKCGRPQIDETRLQHHGCSLFNKVCIDQVCEAYLWSVLLSEPHGYANEIQGRFIMFSDDLKPGKHFERDDVFDIYEKGPFYKRLGMKGPFYNQPGYSDNLKVHSFLLVRRLDYTNRADVSTFSRVLRKSTGLHCSEGTLQQTRTTSRIRSLMIVQCLWCGGHGGHTIQQTSFWLLWHHFMRC